MARRKNPSKFFYNAISVICLVFIFVFLYFMFFDKGKPSDNSVVKPTTQPTETVETEKPADLIDVQVLLGKWKAESGLFINFSKNNVKLGVLGLEKEADSYIYSIRDNKITIEFDEGEPLENAKISVKDATLIIDYGYGKEKFTKISGDQ